MTEGNNAHIFRQTNIFGVPNITQRFVQYTFLASRFNLINFERPEQTDFLTKILFCVNIFVFSRKNYPEVHQSFYYKNSLFVCLEDFLCVIEKNDKNALNFFVETGLRAVTGEESAWQECLDFSSMGHDITRLVHLLARDLHPIADLLNNKLNNKKGGYLTQDLAVLGDFGNISFFLTEWQEKIKTVVLTQNKTQIKNEIFKNRLQDMFFYDDQTSVPLFWAGVNGVLHKNYATTAHILDIAECFLTYPGITKNTSNQLVQFLGCREMHTPLLLAQTFLSLLHKHKNNTLLSDMMTVLFLKTPYGDALLLEDDQASKHSVSSATNKELLLIGDQCGKDIKDLIIFYLIQEGRLDLSFGTRIVDDDKQNAHYLLANLLSLKLIDEDTELCKLLVRTVGQDQGVLGLRKCLDHTNWRVAADPRRLFDYVGECIAQGIAGDIDTDDFWALVMLGMQHETSKDSVFGDWVLKEALGHARNTPKSNRLTIIRNGALIKFSPEICHYYQEIKTVLQRVDIEEGLPALRETLHKKKDQNKNRLL